MTGVDPPWRPFATLVCALLCSVSGCGGGGSDTAGSASPTSPTTITAPSISSQPGDQAVSPGQTATFTVVASGTTPLTYQWQKNGSAISGATSASYTTPSEDVNDDGASFTVVVSNSAGSVTSAGAKLRVSAVARVPTDIVTFKSDVARTGQNLTESVLNLSNVNSSSFGLLRTLHVDGKVDAQPLYLSQLTTASGAHNVAFVATEHDSVYAFDADTGNVIWQESLLGAGEVLSDTHACYQVSPEIGITSTPVIGRNSGPHGALYVVAMSRDASSNYRQRLHALDVTTGTELFGGPTEISATYPTAGGGSTTFDPGQYAERAALLQVNGLIVTSWTSHCDLQPYTGWVIAFDAKTLSRASVLNVAPNSGGRGPAIWMSGDGPGADAAGNIYLLTANGVFETTLDANGFPNGQDYGNSFLKIATSGSTLSVADYFTMSNEVEESGADQDLGSGGEMLLPDLTDANGTTRHLVVGAGKDGVIYVVDRDSMGKFDASSNKIWQQLNGALPFGVFASPAYFNGSVYYGDSGGTLRAFKVANAKLSSSPSSQSPTTYARPGASPAISALGTANAIVWAVENSNFAVLHAYDASDLSRELYNSNQAADNRDHFGAGNKFIAPAVADGKVFVGTPDGVAVFGLR